ncbi:MAG: helix-turn-helix transcriptional regulator [Bdellovibrionota bacterium]
MRSKVKGVSSYLREKRLESELTQMEAARHLGHSTAQYISNLERGLCEPSVEMAINLCEFYGGSRKELYELMLELYEDQLKARFKSKKTK